jgi:hypothetical protein
MYEYYLHYWGDVEENSWVQKDLGIAERNFWFPTSGERAAFKKKLRDVANSHNTLIMFNEEEGEQTRLKTIADMTVLLPDGRELDCENDFGYAYPEEAAEIVSLYGDFSCDCNISRMLKADGHDVPILDCGDTLKITNLKVVLR